MFLCSYVQKTRGANSVSVCEFCVQLYFWHKNKRTYVSHAKAQSFAKHLREEVSHRRHGRHRIPSECICLTQTAQIFADNVYLSTWLRGWPCKTGGCVICWRNTSKLANQILCISVSSVCNDSWHKNKRTYVSHAKAQSFAKCLREVVSHGTESRCPNLWGESNTRKTQNFLHVSTRICGYRFEPLMARIFTNALRGI